VNVDDVFTDAVGVPAITPVDSFNDNPSGKLPDDTDHTYAPNPPDAANDWLYTDPLVAATTDTVDTAIGFTTRTDNTCDDVRPFASVTVTVNDTNPADVGVPDTTPAELNVNPAGADPDDTDHTYGDAPPTADNDWL